MKAVIWTDVFQSVVILIGLIVVVVVVSIIAHLILKYLNCHNQNVMYILYVSICKIMYMPCEDADYLYIVLGFK